MPWSGPLFEGHVCSLGYEVLDWIHAYCCHGPGDVQGEAIDLDDEMRDHIIECYRLDPETGRRMVDEAVLSRPKGRAKSEIAGFVGVAEGFAPVRFDGWDADGQPVGKSVRSPLIKCLATEESQAGNTFENIAFIAAEWGPDVHPDIYGGVSGIRQYQSAKAVYLPHGGEIRACTAGAASKDGGKETHVVADETHLYVTTELRNMYATVARNLGKRKIAEPWMHQTSTAYRPGEQSVFEETLSSWRKHELSARVFVNHREAKGKIDIRDEKHTKKQLLYVYGDSAPWQDLDRKYRDMLDPRICPDDATAARYFLNRPMSTKDAWIATDVVERQNVLAPARPGDTRERPSADVPLGTSITVGFDGSLNDDTTVLRGCRMSDGFLFRLGAWPKPEGAAGIGWEVPRQEVLARIREVHRIFDVVRGYYDPHEWRSDIAALAMGVTDESGRVIHEPLGEKVVVEWPTSSYTAMHNALDRLHTGLKTGEIWHDGDPLAVEHYGNAYIAQRGRLRLVRKENPNSSRKIDTVVGDALATEARADALADGWGETVDTSVIVFR